MNVRWRDGPDGGSRLELASFVDVEVNPETRATPGFLASEEWLAALGRAGFVDPSLVPDAIRLRALHPGFFAAAICGR